MSAIKYEFCDKMEGIYMKEAKFTNLGSHIAGLGTAFFIAVIVASYFFDIPLPKGALFYL